MKLSAIAVLGLISSTNAFVVQKQATTPRVAPLEAKSNKDVPLLTGVVLGWTLAAQVATASVTTTIQTPVSSETGLFSGGAPTTLLAGGAYQAEEGYDSLDMSLPKYTVSDDIGKKFEEKPQKSKYADGGKAFAAPKVKAPKIGRVDAPKADDAKGLAKAKVEEEKLAAFARAEANIEKEFAAKARQIDDEFQAKADPDGKLKKDQIKERNVALAAARRDAETNGLRAKKQAEADAKAARDQINKTM